MLRVIVNYMRKKEEKQQKKNRKRSQLLINQNEKKQQENSNRKIKIIVYLLTVNCRELERILVLISNDYPTQTYV